MSSILDTVLAKGDDVNLIELAKEIEESTERETEFWETQNSDAKDTFQRSIDSVQEIQTVAIDMLKINLLVASIVVAIQQYQIINFSEKPFVIASIPFLCLLGAFFSFVFSYLIAENYYIGVSSSNFSEAVSGGEGKKAYLKNITPVFHSWAERNRSVASYSSYGVLIGITFIFGTVGSISGIHLFT